MNIFKNDCCVFKYFYEYFFGGKVIEWVIKVVFLFVIIICVFIGLNYKLNIKVDVNIIFFRNKDRLGCYIYVSVRLSICV